MPYNYTYSAPDGQEWLRNANESGMPDFTVTDFYNGGVQLKSSLPRQYFNYQGNTGESAPLYQVGSVIRSMFGTPGSSPLSFITEKGPLWAGAIGAGGGYLLGKGMQYAGFEPSALNGYTPLVLGGSLAALLGLAGKISTTPDNRETVNPFDKESRSNGPDESSNMNKSAAMYHDARNFILEKLQGASDLGYVEKANLASKIRNMNPSDAERLKTALRAAAGFGIGQIISRFFFGARGSAAMQGGVIGALASLVSDAIRTNNVHSSMFQGSRYSY